MQLHIDVLGLSTTMTKTYVVYIGVSTYSQTCVHTHCAGDDFHGCLHANVLYFSNRKEML